MSYDIPASESQITGLVNSTPEAINIKNTSQGKNVCVSDNSNCTNKNVWLTFKTETYNIREIIATDDAKFNKSITKNKFIKFNKKSIKYIDTSILCNSNNNIDLPKQPKLQTIDDLKQYILNKNKLKIKSILSIYPEWFNDNLIYAFDILKDDFGMYLSAKKHKKPLDYSNIISNKRTDILNWILNKYDTLYPIFGSNSIYINRFNNHKFRQFIWDCIDTDSGEFLKNLDSKFEIIDNLIPINRLYQICFNKKLSNIFITFIKYFKYWNIEEYLLYNRVPNAGQIALEHDMYYEKFIEKKSPNVLDVLKAYKNLAIFDVKKIVLCAIYERNSTVYFEYFKKEHYFDYDIHTLIRKRDLNGIFIKHVLENNRVLTDSQTKFLWFDLCYLLYKYNYNFDNIIHHQIIKQFIEYCIYTKNYPVYQCISDDDIKLYKNDDGEIFERQEEEKGFCNRESPKKHCWKHVSSCGSSLQCTV